MTTDFVTAVSFGLVSGAKMINKFGRNPDVDTGAEQAVWNGGGLYTGHPTGAAETIEVFSDSASDTAAGTGMRTMQIDGLDENGEEQYETVVLAGLTPVATTTLWTRVFRAYGLTAGSSGANVGTVTIRHTTTTANVFAALPVGYGQTEVAAYTVPAGYTGLLVHLYAVVRGVGGSFDREAPINLLTREYQAAGDGCWRRRRPTTAATTGPLQLAFEGGYLLPARTDIVVVSESASANNTDITAGFDLLLMTPTALGILRRYQGRGLP